MLRWALRPSRGTRVGTDACAAAGNAALTDARAVEDSSQPVESEEGEEEGPFDPEALFVLPITDELDLHTFRPADVKTLVPEYLEACAARGYRDVRIVHGKGKGTLRRTVHAELTRSALVESFQLATPEAGGWGATLVRLKRGGEQTE